MGIGAAFAAGLIGGFTRNIEEERAKRLSDQEKVDQLNLLMAEYAMKPADERSAAGVNAVRDMITAAQSQIEGRESINLIGSRSPGLDLDISKVKGIMDDVATGYKMIGSYKVPVPDDYKDDGKTASSVVLYDAIYQDFLNNRAGFDAHFQQNPGEMIVFRDRLNNLAGDYISNRSTQNGINIRNISPSDIAGWNDLSEYFGIGKTRQFNMEADTLISQVAKVSEDSVAPIVSPIVLPGIYDVESQGANMAVFDMSDLGITTPGPMKAIDRMAQIQGMDSRRFLFEHAKNFEGDIDAMKDSLGVSFDLFLKGAGAAQGSLEQTIAIGDFLYNDKRLQDDPLMQAYAMEPFLPLALTKKQQERMDMGQVVEDAFSKRPLGEQFSELYGAKYTEFESRYSAAKRARAKLNKYREIVGNKTTKSGSILESAYANVLAFFGPTGTVDQVMSLMGISEDDEDYSAIRSRYEASQEAAGDSQLIAQAGTLAFIIAADLARAEDTAGRLSDGDLLRNLQKLRGGDVANTIEGQLAGIDIVIEDTNSIVRGLRVIDKTYTKAGIGGKFTLKQRRFLAADKMARNARDAYLNERAMMGEDGYTTPQTDAPAALTTEGMTPMFSGLAGADTHPAGDYFQMNGRYFVKAPDSDNLIEVTEEQVQSAMDAFRLANTPKSLDMSDPKNRQQDDLVEQRPGSPMIQGSRIADVQGVPDPLVSQRRGSPEDMDMGVQTGRSRGKGTGPASAAQPDITVGQGQSPVVEDTSPRLGRPGLPDITLGRTRQTEADRVSDEDIAESAPPPGAIPALNFAGQKKRTYPDGTVSFGNDSTKYRRVEHNGKPYFIEVGV